MQIFSGVVHEIPDDIEEALQIDPHLLARWNDLTPIQRDEWMCWVTIVKTLDTRAAHLRRMVEDIHDGKRSFNQ